MLELRAVEKRFRRGGEEVGALAGVDLRVADGEMVALVGPSGSGKSTLLHVAGGIDVADAGQVFVGGEDLQVMLPRRRALLRRRRIGFVFQFFQLLPTLSVRENVELPLLLDGQRDSARVDELVDRVGLGQRAGHLPGELSGGEMQRAAIARALVARPQLVLADEPTGNLDSKNGAIVLDLLIEQVRDVGATMVLATHDRGIAAAASRVVSLQDGRVV